jgi:hypothetical protein
MKEDSFIPHGFGRISGEDNEMSLAACFRFPKTVRHAVFASLRNHADSLVFSQFLGNAKIRCHGKTRFDALCSDLLHRILQGPFEVLVSHLQVVLPGDDLAVAHPRADDMLGERSRQLSLPARAEVVEEFGPSLHAGLAKDL